MGLALLYAYRSQTPSMPIVAVSDVLREVNAGQVKKITIAGDKATIELIQDGANKQQAQLPERYDNFLKSLDDYNTANPTRQVVYTVEPPNNSLSLVGSIVLSLLPVLLIGGVFFFMMRQGQGANKHALSVAERRAHPFTGQKLTRTL